MPTGFEPRTPVESYHPGPPRFVTVGEPIRDPVFVVRADTTGLDVDVDIDANDHGRDNLAPRLPSLSASPENHDPDDYEWSVAETPPASDGDVISFATADTAVPRYDAGHDTVAEFEADVPGRYVLELDAPDGTHELTLHAFPEIADVDGSEESVSDDETPNPPRIALDATYDDSAAAFHIESNAELAPSSDASPSDLAVTFLADDRDPLSTAEIEVGPESRTATVPVSALDGSAARVHAAAFDGQASSVQDVLELHPDGTVESPNRPPSWLDDAVIYEIFPRSWAGERGETTFETLIDGDESTGARGVEYLDELGVDAVWLTPVVPAMSAGIAGVPGGPHGYGTTDYMGIAEDLVPEGYEDPVAAYRDFIEACNDRDIRVVFDLVINHAGREIDLFQETIAETGEVSDSDLLSFQTVESWNEDARTFDWFDRVDVARYDDEGSIIEAAPRPTGFGDTGWMPNLNYGNLALREYILAVADFWAREVGVDGFRCDVAFGVPHSFWMEVREIVRDADSAFLMLDETLPNDPAYSASQFDMHFDTYSFSYTAQEVATLDPEERADPDGLIDDVLDRRERGHPSFSRLINATENHDEFRLMNQTAIDITDPDRESVTDADWERAAALQRACFAATVTLPGVPLIYYGQERAISRYGEGRHMGESDGRGIHDGEIFRHSDVRPGGRQRAFMNWETYDSEHLAFYRTLIDRYHDLDVLGPDAELVPIDTGDDRAVSAFVRDATDLSEVSGPDRVFVVLNFEDEPVEVTVPSHVSETSLVTETVATRETDGGLAIEVDTVGVFAAPDPIEDAAVEL